jgi:ABC-type amino acid transport substrate-binding protein
MITVGFEPDFLPLTSLSDTKPGGMIIDILQEIFTRAGQTVEFIPTPLAKHMTALGQGKIDAIAFKAITPGHARGCIFSHSLIKTGAAWFAPIATPWPSKTGSKITTPGTGPLAATLRSKYPQFEIIETASYDASLKAAASGQADVATLNFHIGSYLVQRGYQNKILLPAEPYEELDVALAVIEGDPKNILEKFNAALDDINVNGRIAEIERSWLSQS